MAEIAGLNAALAAQREPLVEAARRLASVASVMVEGEAGTPFGLEVNRALETALEIAAGLGMRTRRAPGGEYGYAETGGDGAGGRLVGVLGHVDVVPAGNRAEWTHDPFDPQVVDGKLYGRGVQDDKGPTLAALFAVRALLDAGVQLPARVRFIFGTDEENLWRDMKAYLKAEEAPQMGFAPDAKFPLIYAEKGLLQVVLEGENTSGLQLSGGEAFNAVPDAVDYCGPQQEALLRQLEQRNYTHQIIPGGVRVLGKAAHAQATEEGVNAVCRLALGLHAAGVHSKTIDFLAGEVGEDPFGAGIFGDVQDEDTGRLKFNAGKIELDGKMERLALDLRLPVSAAKEAIFERLAQTAGRYGLATRQHDWMAPIHVPRESALVQTLMGVYRSVTGDTESQPQTSGGATYARAMPNCVAFGAVFPGRKKVEHQPDEHIRLDDLFLAMEIYARAIYELTR